MTSTYEVTDGAKIYGSFSSQSKADALKRELKTKGIAARVRAVHGETSKPAVKAAPPKKPAKAKTAKTPAKAKTKTEKAPTKTKAKPAEIESKPAKPKAKTKATSKPKKAPKKNGPADMVIDPNGYNDATYLFDNGFIGRFVDEAEIDWDDWDEWDEWGDVEVAGVMYINLYGPNGEYEEGDEYPYHEGMTLGELCKEGDLPQPVTKILDEFYEALENDCDPKKVFKKLDAYLSGKYADGLIIHDLEHSCKRDVSKNLRRRYRA